MPKEIWFKSNAHQRGRIYRKRVAIFDAKPTWGSSHVIADNESGLYELWEYPVEGGEPHMTSEHPDLGAALEALVGPLP
jgi:hypothetical protein